MISGTNKLPLLYTAQLSHYFYSLSLKHNHARNTVGHDQEFRTNGMGKQHFEEWYVRSNYKLHIWAFLWPQKMKQYLQQNNTYKNDAQSFQCTCILYKKYSPFAVKYSNILHHNTLWSLVCFSYQTVTKSAESLLATWEDCLYPYTNSVYYRSMRVKLEIVEQIPL